MPDTSVESILEKYPPKQRSAEVEKILSKYRDKNIRHDVSEVGQFGIPIAGGMAGAALGTMTSPVTGLAGPLGGAGLGGALGQKGADFLSEKLGEPISPQPTKMFGLPLPKNRMLQTGLTMMAGEGLTKGLMSSPVQGALKKALPNIFRTTLDIAPKETTAMIEAGPGKAREAYKFLKTGGYAKAAAKAGLPSKEQSINQFIEKVLAGKEASSGYDLPQIAQQLREAAAKSKTPAQAERMMAGFRQLSQAPKIFIDPSRALSTQEAVKSFDALRTMVNDPVLVEQVGEEKLLGELMKFRKNMSDWVPWDATGTKLAGQKERVKFIQGIGKSLYAKTNELIDTLPRGKIVRAADEIQELGHARKSFTGAFRSPSDHGQGGIKRWGGLGFAPFIASRITGAPMPLTYGAAIASRSPFLARQLMWLLTKPKSEIVEPLASAMLQIVRESMRDVAVHHSLEGIKSPEGTR